MKIPSSMRTAKVSKKHSVMLKCGECDYTLQRKGIRLKKMEIV